MKKLLSLLSVLTISGSAVPTTIAASPYQKENNNNNLKETIKTKSNNKQQEKNNKIISSHKNKNNLWKTASIFAKTIAKTVDNIKNNLVDKSKNDNLKINKRQDNKKNNIVGISEIVIKTNSIVASSGVVLNDKVYFGSADNNVYEYDPATNQHKIVIRTRGDVNSSGITLNNKLYIGSNDHNVYEYDLLELIESNIINMKEQIKRGLYLYYKKQNYNSKIKSISNINLNNLNISNDLNIESRQENKSSNLEENIDICLNVDATFINDSSVKQTQKIVSCSKQMKEIKTFQKMNGFTKSETTSNDKNWSTNINTSVTITASGNAGIPLVTKGKVGVDVEVGGQYNFGGSRSYNISDNSTSSDTEIKTTEDTVTIYLPSQSIVVSPNTTISINVISWQNNIELILSYYQKVKSMVSANFIDENNNKTTFSISIKDAMIKLSENDILPSKIIINNDYYVKLSYDIKSLKQIIVSQTKITQKNNSNINEQNVVFKDNIKKSIVINTRENENDNLQLI